MIYLKFIFCSTGVKLDAREKRLSPAATMVLVALAMTATVAASYSLGRALRSYAIIERLEVIDVCVEYDARVNLVGWNVVVTVKNTGLSDAIIDTILVNGRPLADYSGIVLAVSINSLTSDVNIPIPVGEQRTIELYIKAAEPFKAGSNVEIRLHSKSSLQCFCTVNLPQYPGLLSNVAM